MNAYRLDNFIAPNMAVPKVKAVAHKDVAFSLARLGKLWTVSGINGRYRRLNRISRFQQFLPHPIRPILVNTGHALPQPNRQQQSASSDMR